MNPFGEDSQEELVRASKTKASDEVSTVSKASDEVSVASKASDDVHVSNNKLGAKKGSSRVEPLGRFGHSTVLVNEKLYLWGGWQKGFPEVHSSPEKLQLLSKVDIFDLYKGEWYRGDIQGDPPLGVRGYSCTSVGDNIYYFGGYCGHNWCRHCTLNCLDTTTLQWKAVPVVNDSNSPMKKNACGIANFSEGDKEYLFVFGGVGMLCSANQPEAIYIPWKENPDFGWTNESHLFSLDTKEWITPEVNGDRPPPCAGFTLTKITSTSAILYGGFDSTTNTCLSDVYIVEMSKGSLLWRKFEVVSDQPTSRHDHAAVCIAGPLFGQIKPSILIVGGRDKHWKTLSDVWLLDCSNGKWKQLDVPQFITHRHFHSVSLFPVSQYCVYCILFGGVKEWVQTEPTSNQPILSDTIIIEMSTVHSEWEISAILNSHLMTTGEYKSRLIYRLFEIVKTQSKGKNTKNETLLHNQLKQMELALKESEGKVSSLTKELQEASVSPVVYQTDPSISRAIKAEEIAVEIANDVLKPYLIASDEIKLTGPNIDKGTYGQVVVAQYRNVQVAAKVFFDLPSNKFSDVVLRHTLIKSMQIRHPNMVQLLFASIDKGIILLMEMNHIKLRHVLDHEKSIPKQKKVDILIDVASALSYLHSLHIIHRGVSSTNIVLQQLPFKWCAKLSDFFTGNLFYYTSNIDVLGSAYIAPDTTSIPQELASKVDIFSFGIVAIEVFTTELPAGTDLERDTRLNAIKWPSIVAIIKKCVNIQSSERPSAEQLLEQFRKIN